MVKPLSDGGLRIGVGDFESIDNTNLKQAVGLGSSSRINHQFELPGYRVLSGSQISWLRKAFRHN